MEAHHDAQLVLNWQQISATLGGADKAVSLGTGPTADLSISGASASQFASRAHAHIERRKQGFVLVDHSTNGTYVQTEDERIAMVHRGEMRLWGAGWISLGEPLMPETAIRFHST